MRDPKDELGAWLEGVARGRTRMSERRLTWVDQRGGLRTARTVAKAKRVHLLVVQDEDGNEIVAASVAPFKVVC